MAIVIGTSGAWKKVLTMARTAGIVLNDPSDVGIQLARAQKVLAGEEGTARDELSLRQAELERVIAQKRAAADQDVVRIQGRFQRELALLSEQSAKKRPGAVARAWNVLARLTLQAQERAQIRARLRDVLPAERALQEFLDGYETEVARRVQNTRHIVLGIDAIAHSATLANAIAERNAIKMLSSLPDDFVLMNDLHLLASHDLPFEGGYIREARLGHLLAGPTGIYAIETRSWSRTARAGADEADPIFHVSQAAFLCTQILKDSGVTQIVRSIVASEGAEPTRSGGAHIATLPAARLLAYVEYGPRLLSVQDIADIVRILS